MQIEQAWQIMNDWRCPEYATRTPSEAEHEEAKETIKTHNAAIESAQAWRALPSRSDGAGRWHTEIISGDPAKMHYRVAVVTQPTNNMEQMGGFEREAKAHLMAAAGRMGKAIESVCDRLTAWAEHHEMLARNKPDSEATADVNSAKNYRNLATDLKKSML